MLKKAHRPRLITLAADVVIHRLTIAMHTVQENRNKVLRKNTRRKFSPGGKGRLEQMKGRIGTEEDRNQNTEHCALDWGRTGSCFHPAIPPTIQSPDRWSSLLARHCRDTTVRFHQIPTRLKFVPHCNQREENIPDEKEGRLEKPEYRWGCAV